jgi:hypothetical protein
MSAKKNKTVCVHLKFGPTVITPEQRFETASILGELLYPMPGSSITLLDMSTWTFRVEVPEATPFGMLLFGGLFEITPPPATQPDLSWRLRRNSGLPSRV